MKKILILFLYMFFLSSVFAQVKPYMIKGKDYIRVMDFAKEYDFDISWNTFNNILTLKSKSLTIKLKENENYVLINDNIYELKNNLVTLDGGLFAPYSFMGKIRHKIQYLPETVIRKKPVFYNEQYRIKKVVIDPGHGGKDPGAVARSGLKEKDVVLSISLLLRKMLISAGYQVVITRKTDIFIPLWQRSKIANKYKADLFISIHANASRARSANGIEVYYLSDEMDDYSRAVATLENSAVKYESNPYEKYGNNFTKIALWDLLCDQYRKESILLAKNVISNMLVKNIFKSRGVKGARFYVLKNTTLPSILIETGFLTNTKEAIRLSKGYIRKKIASDIFKGIKNYAYKFRKTKGFSE